MERLVTLIASGAIVVALFAWLVVIGRRRERATRRHTGPTRPDPQPIDRAFDPALCTYCDERGKFPCPACTRNTCAEHRPWPEGRFCYSCEAQWNAGARKRAFVIVPIVIAGMVVVMGVVAFVASFARQATLGALVLPILIAAPLYLRLERLMRRRFRPGAQMPSATVRAR